MGFLCKKNYFKNFNKKLLLNFYVIYINWDLLIKVKGFNLIINAINVGYKITLRILSDLYSRLDRSVNYFMEKNFYEWWKRHRRLITLGGFIILFSLYLSPVIKEAKYKNYCIQNTKKGLLAVWQKEKVEKDIEDKSGLSVEEYAKIEAYRNCNHIK